MKVKKTKIAIALFFLVAALFTCVSAFHQTSTTTREIKPTKELAVKAEDVASTYDLPADEAATTSDPNYTIQTYFNFPRIVTEELNSNKVDSPTLAQPNYGTATDPAPNPNDTPYFINTDNGGDGEGGKLPTNEGRAYLDYLTGTVVEDEDGETRHLETSYELEQMFMDETTSYKLNPQIQYMSRLYNSLDPDTESGEEGYNPNYTLAQVWVYQPGWIAPDTTTPSDSQWIVYSVPLVDPGLSAPHDPSQIRFTNNPSNPYLTISSSVDLPSKAPYGPNDLIKNETVYQHMVSPSAATTPTEEYPYSYTILIQEGTIIRLVYEVTDDFDYNPEANFYDYDISTGNYFLNGYYNGDNQFQPENTALINGFNMYYPQNGITITYNEDDNASIEDDTYGMNPQEAGQSVSANFYHWGINNYNTSRTYRTPVWNNTYWSSATGDPVSAGNYPEYVYGANGQPFPFLSRITGTDYEYFGDSTPWKLSFGNQYFGIDYNLLNQNLEDEEGNKYYQNFYQAMNFTDPASNAETLVQNTGNTNYYPQTTPNFQNGVGVGVFGLVQGIKTENGLSVPLWNDSFYDEDGTELVPNLFGTENPLAIANTKEFGYSKTIYSADPDLASSETEGLYYNLNFYRQGGTYTLNAVYPYQNGNMIDIVEGVTGGIENLRALDSWNSSNSFWPLDNNVSWGTAGHDPKYGGQSGQYGSTYLTTTNMNTQNNVNPDFGQLVQPNNGTALGNGDAHNGAFGMSYEVEFTLQPGYVAPLEYWFYGDDDMWVVLSEVDSNADNGTETAAISKSGEVIADIGGIHGAMGTYTNLWDYLTPIPFDGEEQTYKLTVFYTERGAGGGSCCYMRFSLPLTTNTQAADPYNGLLKFEKELQTDEGTEVAYQNWAYGTGLEEWSAADEEYDQYLYDFELNLSNNGTVYQDIYDYTVYNSATNAPIKSGSIGQLTNKPGQYLFSLWAGTYIVIEGLPDSTTYTITELDNDSVEYSTQYTTGTFTGTADTQGTDLEDGTTYTGSIAPTGDNINSVYFINTLIKEDMYGSLSVTKVTDNETDQSFNFTLSLVNAESEIGDITGTIGTESETYSPDEDGNYKFSLTSGQTIVFENILYGTGYSVTEEDTPDYIESWGATGNEGTIGEENSRANLVAINTYNTPGTGSLIVSKRVVGNNTTEVFNFSVTFTQGEDYYNGPITYVTNEITTPVTEALENGLKEFELANGDSIIFTNLPYNVHYVITESEVENYQVEWTNEENTITSDNPSFSALAVNTYEAEPTDETGTLTVTKMAPEAQATEEFNFTANFSNTSGNLTGNVAYTLSGSSDVQTGMLNNGTLNFTLVPNQSIQFINLPYGTTYELNEINLTGYTVSWTNQTGTISSTNVNPVATATNTKVVVPGEAQLSIEKLQSLGNSNPTKNTLNFNSGDVVTYYLTITNSGESSAKNIVVSDVIPTGLSYVSNSATNGGLYNELTNTISWNINQVSVGLTITVSFKAQIPSNITSKTYYTNIGYAAYNGVQYPSNEVKLENTPATNNSSSNTTTNTTSTINKVSPKTGNDNLGLIVLVVVVAICAAVVYVNYRKNHRKEKEY